MSILTADENNVRAILLQERPMPKAPRNKHGQVLSRICPECDCGTLQCERTAFGFVWRCDGLADPNDPNKPLEACGYEIIHGE